MGNLNDDLIQRAIAAARSGDKVKAKEYLANALKNDSRDFRAWYLLGQVIEKYEYKIQCLEKALELQPDNIKIKEKLKHLRDIGTTQNLSPTTKPQRTRKADSKPGLNPWLIVAVIATIVFVCLAINTMSSRPPTSKVTCVTDHNPQKGNVTKIVDGDTIDVLVDGQTFPVRYIGIDSPEIGDPIGLQAKEQNALLVEGKSVTLYRDTSEKDQYNRLLRYVFVGDLFVNYEMMKTGYGEAKSYSPDTSCDGYFAQAQSEAMAANLGLWAALPPTKVRLSSPVPLETTSNCDPAYPTVCIPPPPPYLNCPDVSYKNFKVLAPDPHHFDREGDGIGCENQ